MRGSHILFLLCFLLGCSSPKYEWNVIETKTTFIHDPLTQTTGMTTSFVGVDKLAQEYLKSGRINQSSDLSCLSEEPVFNFINIHQDYVHVFRPYLIDMEKKVNYKKVEGFRDGKHGSLYKEEIQDNLKVVSRTCFKDFEGEHVAVVTEHYSEKK